MNGKIKKATKSEAGSATATATDFNFIDLQLIFCWTATLISSLIQSHL